MNAKSAYDLRCEREDEEDRLAAIRHELVPNLTGPQAVNLAVECLLHAVDRGALSGWNISFPIGCEHAERLNVVPGRPSSCASCGETLG